jgi:ankyrin repeat protein
MGLIMNEIETRMRDACKAGDVEVVRQALSRGFPVNRTHPEYKWSGLHYAAGYGRLKVVQLLLSAGAQWDLVDYVCHSTVTAIHLRCSLT